MALPECINTIITQFDAFPYKEYNFTDIIRLLIPIDYMLTGTPCPT